MLARLPSQTHPMAANTDSMCNTWKDKVEWVVSGHAFEPPAAFPLHPNEDGGCGNPFNLLTPEELAAFRQAEPAWARPLSLPFATIHTHVPTEAECREILQHMIFSDIRVLFAMPTDGTSLEVLLDIRHWDDCDDDHCEQCARNDAARNDALVTRALGCINDGLVVTAVSFGGADYGKSQKSLLKTGPGAYLLTETDIPL